jgi:hypothetical protein
MDAANLWTKLTRIRTLQFVAESQSGSGWNGRGAGEVRVEQPSEDILIFHEWGEWESTAGKRFRFSNTYRWIKASPQSVRLEHLRFGADQPVFLFELAPADDDAWKSVSPHVCSEDCYTAELHLTGGGFNLRWTVAGAEKQESIAYEYR